MNLLTNYGSVSASQRQHRQRRRPAYLDSGIVLQKRMLYMNEQGWDALQRLCNSYDTSLSKMIEILVLDAEAVHTSQED